MTGKGGDGARWGWMRFGAVFEGKEGIAEMKVAGGRKARRDFSLRRPTLSQE